MALKFPKFDPVLVQIGPLSIRWYALAYITALLLGWRLVRRLARATPPVATVLQVDDFLTWAILGVVVGGRLGYVLFYQPLKFLPAPWTIFEVWGGGMSFHGGMLGVAFAITLYAYRQRIPILGLADRIAVAAPIGLFLGRIANFINGELYGRPSSLPWAMIFPEPHQAPDGTIYFLDGVPRHPSQLYQATLEGIVLFIVMVILVRRPGLRARYGFLTGAFLAGYAVARIIGEHFREPDVFMGFLAGGVTMGQLLSIPMFIAGLVLMVRARRVAVTAPGLMERLDVFMARANALYYATKNPFADFTTSPEISQVFGELLGLWAAETWRAMGSPDPVLLIEAGPGRGTLMADARRAVTAVAPAFAQAAQTHLIETSGALRAAQAGRVTATWHDTLASVPDGPAILLANEFLDALPIRQWRRAPDGWTERFVDLDGPHDQAAEPPERETTEWSEAAAEFVRDTAMRVRTFGGAALFVDYGGEGVENSLQALRDGKPADPFTDPGECDLTAHVDFAGLADIARHAGAAVFGPIPQGLFLTRLGLQHRTGVLARGRDVRGAAALLDGAARLSEPGGMGRLFKVLAITHPDLPEPAGFSA